MNKKIILASSSPRRKELLESLGLKFKVVPSNIEEKLNPRLKPKAQAEYLSRQKANAVAPRFSNAVIIAADTIVVLEDEIHGKPKDREEAKRMLKKLQGKTHEVVTGFTVIDTETRKTVSKSVETKLYMSKLTEKQIASYLEKAPIFDTAGGYMINGLGMILFEKIEGDYTNVVGLPVFQVAKELRKFSIEVL